MSHSTIMPMSPRPPQWANIGVIALVPDTWSSVWMDRHHVLTRLANYFQVVWMHQPGWRQSFAKLGPGSGAPMAPSGALQIYEPGFWLPRLGRPGWLARFTAQRRFKQVYQRLRAQGCTKIVLYVWGLEFAEALDEMPHDFSIYNVSD